MKVRVIVLAGVMICLGAISTFGEEQKNEIAPQIQTEVSSYMPKAAEDAIDKSWGTFLVSIPQLGDPPRGNIGSAFLVTADGLIATALHNLPSETDVMQVEGRMTFNGVPVTIDTFSQPRDLALLRLKEVPKGMVPVTFAKDIPLYSRVFAKLQGLFPYNSNFRLFTGLPFRARLVHSVPELRNMYFGITVPTGVEYFYLDRSVKTGFSGSMFVNKNGEVVGMGIQLDGGYSVLISGKNIQEVIEFSVQKEEERKKKLEEKK